MSTRLRSPLVCAISIQGFLLAGLLAAGLPPSALASPPAVASPPPPAVSDPAEHRLDFWLGDWEVTTVGANRRDGHDRVEKVLNGSAIIEHWSDADGSEGKSWFYYHRPENRWKQVWVTDRGFIKEKVMTDVFPDGSVRFRGEIPLRDGTKVLDQTTLTPLPDGKVHQVIEISQDGGRTWLVDFDAIYTHGPKP